MKITDATLAEAGRLSHEWAAGRMAIIEKIVSKNPGTPLAGIKLGVCLHVTKETSVLVMAAKKLGADIASCSANPLLAQDDIAAYLAEKGVRISAWRGETQQQYK